MNMSRLVSSLATSFLAVSGLVACAAAPSDALAESEGETEVAKNEEAAQFGCAVFLTYENSPVTLGVQCQHLDLETGELVPCSSSHPITRYETVHCFQSCTSTTFKCDWRDSTGLYHPVPKPKEHYTKMERKPCGIHNTCGTTGIPNH
jgi:hypothetical protein